MPTDRGKQNFVATIAVVLFALAGALGCTLPEPPEWLGVEPESAHHGPGVRTTASLPDAEMETFLREGSVITSIPSQIPSTTRPMPLEVAWNGEIRQTIFKYGNVEGKGGAVSPDSYRYEIAAYRLDRRLGVRMVPVAVPRQLRLEGALIEWVSGVGTPDRLEQLNGFTAAEPTLRRQQAVMNLFDALIGNASRRESDQLIEPGSWKLHLIDHSRAFGTDTTLPESFTAWRASLPRELLAKLEGLDEASLSAQIGGFIDDSQIAALLERRDAIVAKIERDRKRHGDAAVFQD